VLGALALFISLGGVGYSATGSSFILGQANTATNQTSLSASVSNATSGGNKVLQLTNSSTAAGAQGLGITVGANKPPIFVNATAGKATNLNSDKLDGLDSTAFLRTTGKAADSDLLDGIDSTGFYAAGSTVANSQALQGVDLSELVSNQCPIGFVSDGSKCWESIDASGFTLAAAANRCRSLGGQLPTLADFEALVKSGMPLGSSVFLDWTSNSVGDDVTIYINNATDSENMDGVRANSTPSYARCIRPFVNTIGSP
jgi:hypothetical protein